MARQALPEPFSMTSTELGLRVGLSQPSISRIRHGERLPSRERWGMICAELLIPEDWCQDAWEKRFSGEIARLLGKVIPL